MNAKRIEKEKKKKKKGCPFKLTSQSTLCMCVDARVRACICVCISIYLRQLRAVNRQVIINRTIERRRVNRPRKRNRGGERFTISNDSQRIVAFPPVARDVLRLTSDRSRPR